MKSIVRFVLLSAIFVGCSSPTSPAGRQAGEPCSLDTDCGAALTCVMGVCQDAASSGDASVDDISADALVPDGPDGPDAADSSSGGLDTADTSDGSGGEGDAQTDAGPEPGTTGAECTGNESCNSGYCISTSEGRLCTEVCVEDCPLGWECRVLTTSGVDIVSLCVPPPDALCEPCAADIDCEGLGNLCLSLSDGEFCGISCDLAATDCPTGYGCEPFLDADGEEIGQCVPLLGVCGGCFDSDNDGFGEGPECAGPDCDDLDGLVYPGGPEICDGFDNNCDGEIDELFDLSTDPANCGECSNVCSVRNGVAGCADSACTVVSCNPGYYDIDGDPSNGCEYACEPDVGEGELDLCDNADNDCDGDIDEDVDTLTDAENCGACGTVCELPGSASVCEAGVCVVSECVEPFADCDGIDAGGCEVNTATSATNCGVCGNVCQLDNAVPACVDSACAVGSCRSNFADCNGEPTDGCETPLLTSATNCGGCGNVCAFPNAAALCEAGACAMGQCAEGFADCNNDPADGCEVNLNTDLSACGACGRVCDLPGASELCVAGVCTLDECAPGLDDCDSLSANGCETDLASSVTHCNGCGNSCSLPNATPVCSPAGCAVGVCNTGFADCDGVAANGCEVDLRNDAENCASCGNECTFEGGTGVCVNSSCRLGECAPGVADCNGNPADGCEQDIRSSAANCGACNLVCDYANAAEVCSSGACQFLGCTPGFNDCNSSLSDGCETGVLSDLSNCGGCGVICDVPNASEVCSFGTCQLNRCDALQGDCNANIADGCEQPLGTDVNNCGACNNVCSVPNGVPACSGGVCGLGRCTAPFLDCNASLVDGCEVNSSTDVDNCRGCGVECTVANGVPICAASGCAIGSCNGAFRDCDGNYTTGCEVDTASDASNCGGCGVRCNGANTANTCSASACVTGPCQPGFVDLDGDRGLGPLGNGCEYACTVTSPTDVPDLNGRDDNCDGVDGTVTDAIFVAPGGSSSTSCGLSQTTPCATIALGITRAAATGRRQVLIASGTYNGSVSMQNGISLYGGYSPANWQRTFAADTTISVAGTSANAYGILANNLTSVTTVDHIRIVVGDSSVTSGNTYGIIANNSGGLRVSYTEIDAGNGGAGSNGSDGTAGASGGRGQDGNTGCDGNTSCSVNGRSGGAGGAGGSSSCAAGTSGGAGGQGRNGAGASGASGGGAGGEGANRCNSGLCSGSCDGGRSTGATGGAGAAGANGANGANGSPGSGGGISGSFWVTASGTDGANGANGVAGRGGGGGGGGADRCRQDLLLGCANIAGCNPDRGGGGGGGGGAGCAGTRGTRGTGGGGSFGIFLVNSSGVVVSNTSITTGNGGRGGNAGAGRAGGAGNVGGTGGTGPDDAGNGGSGGRGGNGGSGGSGGAGAGGPSIGIYRSSSSVTASTGMTFAIGSAGAGGTGAISSLNGSTGQRGNIL